MSDLNHAMEGIQYSTSEFMFQMKIDNLINHHHKQFTMGLLMWPKSFKKWKKKKIMYNSRAEEYIYNSLYVKESNYIGGNGDFIGYGLFSNVDIASNTTIGKYVGTFINYVERMERERRGFGGYFIYFNREETLDCYEERQMKICKLSFANSYVRAVDASTFINAQQNGRLVVNHLKRYASIKTCKHIKAHEEIFIDYGSNYDNVPLQAIHFSGDSH
jgi:hypothetical protein